ncbi:MAG: hypothetical protein JW863_06665 [Chitinispirillaceae bacterium]|nr:hypothetical protein [Chitinispirillaceae bacterium]
MNRHLVACCFTLCFFLLSTTRIYSEPEEVESSSGIQEVQTTDDSGEMSEENGINEGENDATGETGTISEYGDSETGNTSLPEPMSGSTSVSEDEESEPVNYATLLAEGKAKKGAGVALVSVGGVFLGAAIVYTTMFLIDEETFGIRLFSTTSSSGYYTETKTFYLNPGIFGIPIGAPCMAVGIVNLIKGKKMIQRASVRTNASSTPVEIIPYLSFARKSKTVGTGFVARF